AEAVSGETFARRVVPLVCRAGPNPAAPPRATPVRRGRGREPVAPAVRKPARSEGHGGGDPAQTTPRTRPRPAPPQRRRPTRPPPACRSCPPDPPGPDRGEATPTPARRPVSGERAGSSAGSADAAALSRG